MDELILAALRSFPFGRYGGLYELDEFMQDEDLEIGPDLAAHISMELSNSGRVNWRGNI